MTCRHHLQMLVEAAPVFIRLPAVVALEIARRGLLLLGQVRAVTGSSQAVLGLVYTLKGRQRRSVYNGAVTTRPDRSSGYVLREAARHRRVPAVGQRAECRFGHGASAVDRQRTIGHGMLDGRTNGRRIGGGREGRALSPIDAVLRSQRAVRGRVRMRAAVGIADGEAHRGRGDRGTTLARGA